MEELFGEDEELAIIPNPKKNLESPFTFETRFSCLQGWFLRASWFNKLHFIQRLLQNVRDRSILQMVLCLISSAKYKDTVYVMSQEAINTKFDSVLQDSNRELDILMLIRVSTNDEYWFTTLDKHEKICILMGLLQMGNSALVRVVYDEIVSVIQHNSRLEASMKNCFDMSEPDVVRRKSRLNTPANIVPVNSEEALLHEHQSIWENKLSHFKKQFEGRSRMSESKDKGGKKKGEKGKVKGKRHTKSKNEEDNIDYIQMLPLSINRAILKYLNNNTLMNLKKVNSYWAYMVTEFLKEEKARGFIDSCTDRLKKQDYPSWKRLDLNEFVKVPPEILKSLPAEPEELAPGIDTSLDLNEFRKLVNSPTYFVEKCNKAYTGNYCVSNIVNTFMHSRVIACDMKSKLMAVSTSQQSIIFYSLTSGALLPPVLNGHSGIITCLCFHLDGNAIFSGSHDKTVRYWDIWSGRVLVTYTGHNSSVTAISVDKDLIASCGLDGYIKAFSIKTGVCLASFWDYHPVMAVQLKNSLIYSGCHQGVIKCYSITPEELIIQLRAHNGQVLSIAVSGLLLITSGDDGFLKIWNCNNLQEGYLISLKHDRPMKTFFLTSPSKILTGCTGGCLQLQCCLTKKALRTIPITRDNSSIFSIYCMEYKSYVKMVVNTATSVQFYEFYDPKKVTHKHEFCVITPKIPECGYPPFTCKGLNKSADFSSIESCKFHKFRALAIRGSADFGLLKGSAHLASRSIMTEAIQFDPSSFADTATNLKTFPRNEDSEADGLPEICNLEGHLERRFTLEKSLMRAIDRPRSKQSDRNVLRRHSFNPMYRK